MNLNFWFFDLPWWGCILTTLALTHITIAGVTIYLHRYSAHGALWLHPVISHFFRLWLWLTTGMSTKAWTAIHRKHHAKCETADDPHSPKILGLRKVLLEGSELYRSEARNPETLSRYGHGTPDDMIERKVYTPYSRTGVGIMLIGDALLFGPIGITIWAVQMLWIPIFAAGGINGLGHYYGYRNCDTPDWSTNISPIGILIGGEELHNNHHAYPRSAKLSLHKWEFDIGWLYIRVFETLGLARVKSAMLIEDPTKTEVDPETVHAIRTDNGYFSALMRKLLLSQIKRELEDKALNASWGTLGELRSILEEKPCNGDPLLRAHEKIQTLKGTKSLLPLIGRFIDLHREIKKSSREIVTTEEREERLLSGLREWVSAVKSLGVPKAVAFVDRLVQLVRPKKV